MYGKRSIPLRKAKEGHETDWPVSLSDTGTVEVSILQYFMTGIVVFPPPSLSPSHIVWVAGPLATLWVYDRLEGGGITILSPLLLLSSPLSAVLSA